VETKLKASKTQHNSFKYIRSAKFLSKAAINSLSESVCICESQRDKAETKQVWKTAKMLKKITTEIRAAVMLIIAENLTALRAFFKNVANSVSNFNSEHQEAIWQNKKRP
jgi:hypothetical protein